MATVLNTDAGLSGKTLVNAEDTQTITGAKTFDRDPSAPFAVSSGSAVVTNLDADKLDGSEGSSYVHKTNDCVWSAWTPTLTNMSIGNGTMTSKYLQLGKLVFFNTLIVFGTTTSVTGDIEISLPVTAVAPGQMPIGHALLYDDSTATPYMAQPTLVATTRFRVLSVVTSGATATTTDTTALVPFTWATSDQIRVYGFFEAA
jgi:hypothetical protein